MEKTVPRDYPVEFVFERAIAHVSQMPRALRKALTAEGYKSGRGINSVYREASIDEIPRYWLAGATANVEYGRTLREKGAEPIKPLFFVPADARAIGDIVMSMSLVEINNLVAF